MDTQLGICIIAANSKFCFKFKIKKYLNFGLISRLNQTINYFTISFKAGLCIQEHCSAVKCKIFK
jgi:hypothetical protein